MTKTKKITARQSRKNGSDFVKKINSLKWKTTL